MNKGKTKVGDRGHPRITMGVDGTALGQTDPRQEGGRRGGSIMVRLGSSSPGFFFLFISRLSPRA
jgi:hypothetical protein